MAHKLVAGPVSPVYLVDADGNPIGSGAPLYVILEAGDIEIGAVELKDATTDTRAIVTATGDLQITLGGEAVAIDQTTPGTTDRVTAGGAVETITVTPTLTVAGAYVANDFVGTSATGITFAGAARVANGSGVIESAVLVDYALQSAVCELWLFDVTPAGLPADNAAFTITDAAALTCIGVISFDTYYASALNSVAPATGLQIAFTAVGGTSIFGALVTRGAPTYACGDVSFRLQIMQD